MNTDLPSTDPIISQFRISPDLMPKISTPTMAPNYTSIRKFQPALEENALSEHQGTNTPRNPPTMSQAIIDGVPVSYCWTHGITRNLQHTSSTCKRKGDGHQDDATYYHRKGSNQNTLGQTSAWKFESASCNTGKINSQLSHTHDSTPVILDTGATHHFYTESSAPQLSNMHLTPNGIRVLLPNNNVIKSKYKASLNIPNFPTPAQAVHLFSTLASNNLLSIGQLCDHGCRATFDRNSATITHNNVPILHGTRNPTTKLWTLNTNTTTPSSLQPSVQPATNLTIGQPTTAARMRFYHAAVRRLLYIWQF